LVSQTWSKSWFI